MSKSSKSAFEGTMFAVVGVVASLEEKCANDRADGEVVAGSVAERRVLNAFDRVPAAMKEEFVRVRFFIAFERLKIDR